MKELKLNLGTSSVFIFQTSVKIRLVILGEGKDKMDQLKLKFDKTSVALVKFRGPGPYRKKYSILCNFLKRIFLNNFKKCLLLCF